MVFAKCCCCVELRKGGMILGILGIIGSILEILVGILGFVNLEETSVNLTGRTDGEGVAIVTLVVLIVISALYLMACVFLILAIQRNNHKLVIPWMVLTMISIVLYAISTIINITNNSPPSVYGGGIIGIGLSIYWWLCIYSLYKELK